MFYFTELPKLAKNYNITLLYSNFQLMDIHYPYHEDPILYQPIFMTNILSSTNIDDNLAIVDLHMGTLLSLNSIILFDFCIFKLSKLLY